MKALSLVKQTNKRTGKNGMPPIYRCGGIKTEIENSRILFVYDGFQKIDFCTDLIANVFRRRKEKTKIILDFFYDYYSVPSFIFSKN